MYELLIIEDEPSHIETFTHIVEPAFPQIHITKCCTYEEAVRYIDDETLSFHFFFLDIDLHQGDEKNGLILGQHIRSISRYLHIPIIFTAAFSDCIFFTLNELPCANYLVKPYTTEKVCETISLLIDSPATPQPAFLVTDISGIIFQIRSADILFAEACLKMIKIYTPCDTITTRQFSLKSLLGKFTDSSLIQCHKKYIVNIDFLTNYDRTNRMIHIMKKSAKELTLPVGRTYKNNFEEKMHLFQNI